MCFYFSSVGSWITLSISSWEEKNCYAQVYLFQKLAITGEHVVYKDCSEGQNKKKQFMYKSCSPDVLSLQFSIFMKMFCQSFWHRFTCKADQIHKMTTISIKMTPLFILRSYNYYRALVHPAQFWLPFLWFAQLYITDPVTSFLARDKSHDSTANS